MAAEQKKIAADLLSGINYNKKNFRKVLFSGINPSISILQVTKKTQLQCINLLTCDFSAFGPTPTLQTLSGLNGHSNGLYIMCV